MKKSQDLHVLLHHKETRTCNLCGETFVTQSCLYKHMLIKHQSHEKNEFVNFVMKPFGHSHVFMRILLMKHQSHENPDL